MPFSSFVVRWLAGGCAALGLAGCAGQAPASKAAAPVAVVSFATAVPASPSAAAVAPLYRSAAFTVWPDRVEQGAFVARALSATHLTSNYQSPASRTFNRRLEFKFALNGRDNELPVGVNHTLVLFPEAGQPVAAPTIEFGKLLKQERPVPTDSYLESNTRLKLRLDMRPVLAAFKAQGHFDTFNGQRIYAKDFKGVFVAGGSEPLSWDFDNLATRPQYQLQDPEGDGIYEIDLLLNPAAAATTTREWKLTKDLSRLPQYHSAQPLVDALWNLSLEEMLLDIRPDETFMAGAKWDGVWTRDISYSIILSLAHLRPDIARNSLRRKVTDDGRIIQDTGTGGSWPCSSDRITWALAAWEVYLASGDEEWLIEASRVIQKSLEADEKTVAMSGQLVRGESSFLDWRQQTYPRWMQPADIYESRTLGTNAVFNRAYRIMAETGRVLQWPVTDTLTWDKKAARHQRALNADLWAAKEGYYGQFRYGRPFADQLSPRWEALGEALAVLYGIAPPDRAAAIVKNAPALRWGTPTIWPMIPDVPPYHNQSVWPFVQAYWNWALAKQPAGAALEHGLACLYRPAALFLTNKENLTATDGDFKGTEINSDRQLWSVAGDLAMVTRVFFGMDFQPAKLVLAPCVPAAYPGEKVLSNFTYRAATLTLRLRGTGNRVKSVTLDGAPVPTAEISGDLRDAHEMVIELTNEPLPAGPPVRLVEPIAAAFPPEPAPVPATAVVAQAEPEHLTQHGPGDLKPQGFTGKGYAVLTRAENRTLKIRFQVKEAGRYVLDFRYANGSGPVNIDNKCAVRALAIDGKAVGPVVLPQRGANEWSDWGWSSANAVDLKAGEHVATLTFESWNENMNAQGTNTALIDYLRVWRP